MVSSSLPLVFSLSRLLLPFNPFPRYHRRPRRLLNFPNFRSVAELSSASRCRATRLLLLLLFQLRLRSQVIAKLSSLESIRLSSAAFSRRERTQDRETETERRTDRQTDRPTENFCRRASNRCPVRIARVTQEGFYPRPRSLSIHLSVLLADFPKLENRALCAAEDSLCRCNITQLVRTEDLPLHTFDSEPFSSLFEAGYHVGQRPSSAQRTTATAAADDGGRTGLRKRAQWPGRQPHAPSASGSGNHPAKHQPDSHGSHVAHGRERGGNVAGQRGRIRSSCGS